MDEATRGAARELGQEGVAAYQAEDYETASDRLERAYSVLRAPALALWSARALEKRGLLVEASERYLEGTRIILDDSGDRRVQEKAQEESRMAYDALAVRIPSLVVEVEGATTDEVELTVGGKTVSSALIGTKRPTNPGAVEVVGQVGEQRVTEEVTLLEGQVTRVTLKFSGTAPVALTPAGENAAEKPPLDDGVQKKQESRWQSTAGWAAVGVGAGGLVLGAVTGALAMGKRGSLDCPDNVCPAGTEEAQIKKYDTLRTLSSVGIITGGILAAAGVTLLLTAPSSRERASLVPYVGVASTGIKGTF